MPKKSTQTYCSHVLSFNKNFKTSDRRPLHLSCYNDNDDDNKMNLETSINLVDVFDDDNVFKYS